jgi:hypothetical protein
VHVETVTILASDRENHFESRYVAENIVSDSHFLNEGLSLNCLKSSVWSDNNSTLSSTRLLLHRLDGALAEDRKLHLAHCPFHAKQQSVVR